MEVVRWVLSAASLVHWCLQIWMNWRHKAWLRKHLHELESEEIELFIDLLIYGLIHLIQPLSRNSHFIYNINISLFFSRHRSSFLNSPFMAHSSSFFSFTNFLFPFLYSASLLFFPVLFILLFLSLLFVPPPRHSPPPPPLLPQEPQTTVIHNPPDGVKVLHCSPILTCLLLILSSVSPLLSSSIIPVVLLHKCVRLAGPRGHVTL